MSIYDPKGAVLEKMDVQLFMEHLDPDWKDHYDFDTHIAFEQITEYMSPAEIESAIKESGCMTDAEYVPVHLRNQAE
jgi:hypothetical protein